MEIIFKEFTIKTKRKYEIVDLTNEVENFVRNSNIKEGICLIFLPHATTCLIANENEENLKEDIIEKIKKDFEGNWRHNFIDDNASAHLASSYLKQFLIFPIKNNELIRGTWQRILLIELDRSRERKVIIEILGKK
ncbi:MAG: secondary thiamine-phosphate synthase enzyme YjbQ [Candidatus Aenigmatarchaeota archaeon]